MIGDFICYSQNYGYTDTNNGGHKLEAWAEKNKMTIIISYHHPLTLLGGGEGASIQIKLL